MASLVPATPAFGEADLSNCEREQINLAGSIQPHGALLVVSEPDLIVVQASANAAEFLNLADGVLNRTLKQLGGNLSERLQPHLTERLHTIPMAVRCRIGEPAEDFDGLLHRPADGGLVIELERSGPPIDVSAHVETALRKVLDSATLNALCDQTADIFRELTGYDRVMVYRFDDEGHGEVFSEVKEPDLEPFLGNRYPASDIPQIARRLYERNRVRVLVDVNYEPVPLTPRLSPITGRDFDMSLCFLRSMSPIHIQYLKNMGVGATLVASLVVGGKLWGLIACHHYSPRVIHYELRAVCELLAETVATRIAALESFAQTQSELVVRRLERRMVEAISQKGDWRTALFDTAQSLLQPLNATGAALLFDDEVLTVGEAPGTKQIRDIAEWLDGQPKEPVRSTAALGFDEPAFEGVVQVASGLVAVPVSNTPGEYLLWFRPERIRTVTWGGNPFKSVVIGDDPSDLSPRRSFAQWHQLVEGTADPWNPADLAAAKLIGETVSDVVSQFRSVRLLIAHNQLDKARQQVASSGQPVIITDATGRILLTNETFEQLLPRVHPHLERLEDLPTLFSDPSDVRRQLDDLVSKRQAWRAELALKTELGEPKPLLMRGDPVFSAPDRLLGFVLMFSDLTERKAADAARRRFQEDIVEQHQVSAVRLDTKEDLVYRDLLSSIVGNAQLAALEITDGVDLARVPKMLDSVQTSAARTAELLEHLIWHANRSSQSD